jgi:hypothetical protein
MERLAAEIRRRKYSIRTEQTDASWVCRFILFCGGCDPSEVGADRMVACLEDLAVRGRVSASTQSKALNALVFLYKPVLGQALNALGDFTRAKRPRRLPVVLSRGEVATARWHAPVASAAERSDPVSAGIEWSAETVWANQFAPTRRSFLSRK